MDVPAMAFRLEGRKEGETIVIQKSQRENEVDYFRYY